MKTMFEEGEAAIVIAAAHAETIAARVETDQWCEYQIQFAAIASLARMTHRLWNSEAIALHRAATRIRREPECAGRRQHGQVDSLAHGQGAAQQRTGVDLAVHRQITGDVPGASEEWMGQQTPRQRMGARRALGVIERAASGAKLGAEFGSGGHINDLYQFG